MRTRMRGGRGTAGSFECSAPLTIWRQAVLDDPADLRLSASCLFLFLGLISGGGAGPGLRVAYRCVTVLALGAMRLIVLAYSAGWLRLKF